MQEGLVTLLLIVISLRFQWFPGGEATMNETDQNERPRLAWAVVLCLGLGMPLVALVPDTVPVPGFTGPIRVAAE